jgi:CBS-domain-containing membrane protein
LLEVIVMPLTHYEDGLRRLESLTVSDVMSYAVKVIPASASMHQAAHYLDLHHATGAPVVDDEGRCIGILSASDFVTFEIYRTGDEPSSQGKSENASAKREYLPWNAVRRFMTTAVQTVSRETPVLKAAQIMCAEHIHRLIVLNERSAPIGIISTLDVIATLLNAAEEANQGHRAK